MRRVLIFGLFLLLFSFLLKTKTESANAQNFHYSVEEGRVIVKFRSLVPGYFRKKTMESFGLLLDEKLRLQNTYAIRVPKGKEGDIAEKLSGKLFVSYAEKDHLAEAYLSPNDTFYDQQWGLGVIDMEGAWEVTTGSSDVDIAIVDSGVDASHPDLYGKVEISVDCTYSDCPQSDYVNVNDHATHVAGIAASVTNNSIGVAGVAGGADLMSVKVLGEDGVGYYSWIANGIVWATDNGAEVINLSLGGRFSSSTLRDAVEYAWDAGVVIAAAAGNDGRYTFTYPAYYSEVIAVAATDENDEKAYFSNYGRWIDIAAPGTNIISTDNGTYLTRNGTSMATPLVSGVAALIISSSPELNNEEVREKIENSADVISGTGFYFRNGRLNACEALDCDKVTLPTNTPTPENSPTPTSISTPTPTEAIEQTPTPTSTPTPTATETVAPTFTPTPTSTSTPTPTPTPTPTHLEQTPTPTPEPTSTDTPSPSPLPWWCQHVPWHYTCQ